MQGNHVLLWISLMATSTSSDFMKMGNLSRPHNNVEVLIHYINLGLFSAQIFTLGFDVLETYPDYEHYVGRVLPQAIQQELQLDHGVIFDINRELIREEEYMIEEVSQATHSELAT
ncbi:hypothetical protein PIB30_073842 [Stylosanthes scabra]|uniref:Uncharacterized protein n=1 Tax=Stylosanthes scabra TaxID=79078 RepID=A0ABU6VMX8_9FABA|nr:hypothetical protein [Stylosanthes scabra]